MNWLKPLKVDYLEAKINRMIPSGVKLIPKIQIINEYRIPTEFRLFEDGRLHCRASGITYSFKESVEIAKKVYGVK